MKESEMEMPRSPHLSSVRRVALVWAAGAGLSFGNTLCVADQSEVPAKNEQALTTDAPLQVINALMQRLYAIGETSGSVAEGTEAEKTAADGIRKYTASGSTDGLIATTAMGQTPLIAAAYNGYRQVVVALLESEVVRQRINDRDKSGGTAWLYANMALRQSAFACNPSILSNVFAWEPLMVTQFFYIHAPESPYRAIRTVLQGKGADGTLEDAKRFWIEQCKREDARTKNRIEQSNDVLDTATKIGIEAFTQFIVEQQRKGQQPPAPTPGPAPGAPPR
jgi:hypothetical protein